MLQSLVIQLDNDATSFAFSLVIFFHGQYFWLYTFNKPIQLSGMFPKPLNKYKVTAIEYFKG